MDDDVLEVGAGAGALTVAMAPRCRRLVAVELDEQLVRVVRAVVREDRNVEVVAQDILRFDTAAHFPSGRHVVVGNIPYYLTGALLEKLLEQPPQPRRLSLVVQREVALRWTGASGWSLATLVVQTLAEPSLELTIPASAFFPQPEVDSALVTMTVRAEPAVSVADLRSFFRFAERVFQFRRKQLAGIFARLTNATSAAAAERLSRLDIDPTRRPESLALEEWERLHRVFAAEPRDPADRRPTL